MRIIADGLTAVPIGRRGENAVTEIAFSRYEDFNAQVSFLRPGAQDPYPVTPTIDGDFIIWTISNVDTAEAGSGKVEVVFFEGDKVKKTQTYLTLCANTLGPVGEVPDPLESWYQDILRAAAEAVRGASDSEEYAEEAKSYAENSAGSAAQASTYSSNAASFASLATESATAAQRSANEAEDCSIEARNEADRAGATAEQIRTEYTGAFSEFKEEYTADFNDAKEDIIQYKTDAESSAQRAEESATRAEQDYSELDERKMERYVMRLVKNADNTYKFTSLEDEDLTFDEVYNVTKKLNEYVVVLYGNSKLRPQYVSTNEIMFIGVDRSTETKVLRILYTPTRLSYETFKLAESSDLNGYVKDTDYATTSKGGVIKGNANGFVVSNSGNPNCNVRTYTQYSNDATSYFIGKGTLENVWSARHVTLTQAEYDALSVKDPKTEYNIIEE